MIDVETVISGLECCVTGDLGNCKECPYGIKACNELLKDAISLLKAQQPRVMTLEEVKRASGHDLFLEISGYPDKMTYMTAITLESVGTKGISVYGNRFNFDRYNFGNYGWRCWTARPTDAQREAEPWEN
jgi:hypothetical protein